jgi:hypothetical protein
MDSNYKPSYVRIASKLGTEMTSIFAPDRYHSAVFGNDANRLYRLGGTNTNDMLEKRLEFSTLEIFTKQDVLKSGLLRNMNSIADIIIYSCT